MSAILRIDLATPELLAVYERNLRKQIKAFPNSVIAVVSQTLLNRVIARQCEWAERNWMNSSVQMAYHQLLQTNGIEPPII